MKYILSILMLVLFLSGCGYGDRIESKRISSKYSIYYKGKVYTCERTNFQDIETPESYFANIKVESQVKTGVHCDTHDIIGVLVKSPEHKSPHWQVWSTSLYDEYKAWEKERQDANWKKSQAALREIVIQDEIPIRHSKLDDLDARLDKLEKKLDNNRFWSVPVTTK